MCFPARLLGGNQRKRSPASTTISDSEFNLLLSARQCLMKRNPEVSEETFPPIGFWRRFTHRLSAKSSERQRLFDTRLDPISACRFAERIPVRPIFSPSSNR